MIRYVPNILTSIRIALAPCFVVATALGRPRLALFLFLLGSLTDMLDGLIARQFNAVSAVGKALDPLADKITLIAILICLRMAKRIPDWLLAALALREVLMVIAGLLMWKKRIPFAADWFGKVTTVLFFLSGLLLFPWHEDAFLLKIGYCLLTASAVGAVLTLIHYAIRYAPRIFAKPDHCA